MGKSDNKPKLVRPSAPAAPPAQRPTPPAPAASAASAAAEVEAAQIERAETIPVVIIPPVDADTALVMANTALRARVAELEKVLAETMNTGSINYTRIHNVLHPK